MKIFGREPAAYAGIAQGVLGVLLALGVFGLDGDLKVTLIQAFAGAAFGLVSAIYTKQVSVAVAVGAVQALISLLVGFGFEIDAGLQAAVVSGLQIALAGFLRQNTEAAVNPGLHDEPLTGSPTSIPVVVTRITT